MIDEVTLRVINGPGTGRRVRVPRGGIVLGRDVEGPGAFAADHLISSRHAEIRWDSSGHLYIRDLGSTNGTFINGAKVDEWDLNPGDQIEIGLTLLELSIPEVSTAVATGSSAGVHVEGGQSAQSGGANVGGPNYGVIRTHSETHDWEVNVEDELSWWTRARGPARFVAIVAIVLALAGFGSFAYPIVSMVGRQDGTQQAMERCYATYPQPGQNLANCLATAARPSSVGQINMGPWIQVGGGLFFIGAILMVVARLLPGANPQQTRRKRR